MKKFLFAAAGLAILNFATAQSEIENDATLNDLSLENAVVVNGPGDDKPAEEGGLQISGYVDGFWQTKLNQPNTPVQDRSFYSEAEEFSLGNVAITLEKQMGKAGAVGQVGFGPRTQEANFNDPTLNIQQLFVYYNLTDQLTATAGRFGTFIGYEVVNAPSNFHYSTSNLFQNGPFFHTGLKLDYDLGNGFGIMAGVFNPTDFEAIGPDQNYFYGGQLSYSNDTSAVYLNGLHGKESSSLDFTSTQIDLVATTTVSDIMLAINGSYKTFNSGSNDAAWYGIAGYAQYALSDSYSAGLRAEYFNDEDAVLGKWNDGMGNGGSVFAITASTPFSKDGFTFIPEVRFDIAENDVYTGKNAGDMESTQVVIGAAVNYAF